MAYQVCMSLTKDKTAQMGFPRALMVPSNLMQCYGQALLCRASRNALAGRFPIVVEINVKVDQ